MAHQKRDAVAAPGDRRGVGGGDRVGIVGDRRVGRGPGEAQVSEPHGVAVGLVALLDPGADHRVDVGVAHEAARAAAEERIVAREGVVGRVEIAPDLDGARDGGERGGPRHQRGLWRGRWSPRGAS